MLAQSNLMFEAGCGKKRRVIAPAAFTYVCFCSGIAVGCGGKKWPSAAQRTSTDASKTTGLIRSLLLIAAAAILLCAGDRRPQDYSPSVNTVESVLRLCCLPTQKENSKIITMLHFLWPLRFRYRFVLFAAGKMEGEETVFIMSDADCSGSWDVGSNTNTPRIIGLGPPVAEMNEFALAVAEADEGQQEGQPSTERRGVFNFRYALASDGVRCRAASAMTVAFDATKNDFSMPYPPGFPRPTTPPPSKLAAIAWERSLVVAGATFYGGCGGLAVTTPPHEEAHPIPRISSGDDDDDDDDDDGGGGGEGGAADPAAIWATSPLHISVANCTFTAGRGVLRFSGALPPRSSLIITGNIFEDISTLLRRSTRSSMINPYGEGTASSPPPLTDFAGCGATRATFLSLSTIPLPHLSTHLRAAILITPTGTNALDAVGGIGGIITPGTPAGGVNYMLYGHKNHSTLALVGGTRLIIEFNTALITNASEAEAAAKDEGFFVRDSGSGNQEQQQQKQQVTLALVGIACVARSSAIFKELAGGIFDTPSPYEQPTPHRSEAAAAIFVSDTSVLRVARNTLRIRGGSSANTMVSPPTTPPSQGEGEGGGTISTRLSPSVSFVAAAIFLSARSEVRVPYSRVPMKHPPIPQLASALLIANGSDNGGYIPRRNTTTSNTSTDAGTRVSAATIEVVGNTVTVGRGARVGLSGTPSAETIMKLNGTISDDPSTVLRSLQGIAAAGGGSYAEASKETPPDVRAVNGRQQPPMRLSVASVLLFIHTSDYFNSTGDASGGIITPSRRGNVSHTSLIAAVGGDRLHHPLLSVSGNIVAVGGVHRDEGEGVKPKNYANETTCAAAGKSAKCSCSRSFAADGEGNKGPISAFDIEHHGHSDVYASGYGEGATIVAPAAVAGSRHLRCVHAVAAVLLCALSSSVSTDPLATSSESPNGPGFLSRSQGIVAAGAARLTVSNNTAAVAGPRAAVVVFAGSGRRGKSVGDPDSATTIATGALLQSSATAVVGAAIHMAADAYELAPQAFAPDVKIPPPPAMSALNHSATIAAVGGNGCLSAGGGPEAGPFMLNACFGRRGRNPNNNNNNNNNNPAATATPYACGGSQVELGNNRAAVLAGASVSLDSPSNVTASAVAVAAALVVYLGGPPANLSSSSSQSQGKSVGGSHVGFLATIAGFNASASSASVSIIGNTVEIRSSNKVTNVTSSEEQHAAAATAVTRVWGNTTTYHSTTPNNNINAPSMGAESNGSPSDSTFCAVAAVVLHLSSPQVALVAAASLVSDEATEEGAGGGGGETIRAFARAFLPNSLEDNNNTFNGDESNAYTTLCAKGNNCTAANSAEQLSVVVLKLSANRVCLGSLWSSGNGNHNKSSENPFGVAYSVSVPPTFPTSIYSPTPQQLTVRNSFVAAAAAVLIHASAAAAGTEFFSGAITANATSTLCRSRVYAMVSFSCNVVVASAAAETGSENTNSSSGGIISVTTHTGVNGHFPATVVSSMAAFAIFTRSASLRAADGATSGLLALGNSAAVAVDGNAVAVTGATTVLFSIAGGFEAASCGSFAFLLYSAAQSQRAAFFVAARLGGTLTIEENTATVAGEWNSTRLIGEVKRYGVDDLSVAEALLTFSVQIAAVAMVLRAQFEGASSGIEAEGARSTVSICGNDVRIAGDARIDLFVPQSLKTSIISAAAAVAIVLFSHATNTPQQQNDEIEKMGGIRILASAFNDEEAQPNRDESNAGINPQRSQHPHRRAPPRLAIEGNTASVLENATVTLSLRPRKITARANDIVVMGSVFVDSSAVGAVVAILMFSLTAESSFAMGALCVSRGNKSGDPPPPNEPTASAMPEGPWGCAHASVSSNNVAVSDRASVHADASVEAVVDGAALFAVAGAMLWRTAEGTSTSTIAAVGAGAALTAANNSVVLSACVAVNSSSCCGAPLPVSISKAAAPTVRQIIEFGVNAFFGEHTALFDSTSVVGIGGFLLLSYGMDRSDGALVALSGGTTSISGNSVTAAESATIITYAAFGNPAWWGSQDGRDEGAKNRDIFALAPMPRGPPLSTYSLAVSVAGAAIFAYAGSSGSTHTVGAFSEMLLATSGDGSVNSPLAPPFRCGASDGSETASGQSSANLCSSSRSIGTTDTTITATRLDITRNFVVFSGSATLRDILYVNAEQGSSVLASIAAVAMFIHAHTSAPQQASYAALGAVAGGSRTDATLSIQSNSVVISRTAAGRHAAVQTTKGSTSEHHEAVQSNISTAAALSAVAASVLLHTTSSAASSIPLIVVGGGGLAAAAGRGVKTAAYVSVQDNSLRARRVSTSSCNSSRGRNDEMAAESEEPLLCRRAMGSQMGLIKKAATACEDGIARLTAVQIGAFNVSIGIRSGGELSLSGNVCAASFAIINCERKEEGGGDGPSSRPPLPPSLVAVALLMVGPLSTAVQSFSISGPGSRLAICNNAARRALSRPIGNTSLCPCGNNTQNGEENNGECGSVLLLSALLANSTSIAVAINTVAVSLDIFGDEGTAGEGAGAEEPNFPMLVFAGNTASSPPNAALCLNSSSQSPATATTTTTKQPPVFLWSAAHYSRFNIVGAGMLTEGNRAIGIGAIETVTTPAGGFFPLSGDCYRSITAVPIHRAGVNITAWWPPSLGSTSGRTQLKRQHILCFTWLAASNDVGGSGSNSEKRFASSLRVHNGTHAAAEMLWGPTDDSGFTATNASATFDDFNPSPRRQWKEAYFESPAGAGLFHLMPPRHCNASGLRSVPRPYRLGDETLTAQYDATKSGSRSVGSIYSRSSTKRRSETATSVGQLLSGTLTTAGDGLASPTVSRHRSQTPTTHSKTMWMHTKSIVSFATTGESGGRSHTINTSTTMRRLISQSAANNNPPVPHSRTLTRSPPRAAEAAKIPTTVSDFAPHLSPLQAAPGGEEAQQSAGSLAIVSVMAANPLAMLQLDAVLSVMDMASCAEGSLLSHARWENASKTGETPDERPYDVSNNPLHLFIGREEGAADRGALITSIIVLALGTVVLVARSAAAARRELLPTSEGASPDASSSNTVASPFAVLPFVGLPLVRFPSALLLPATLAMRFAVRSGVRLAVLSSDGGDVAFGVIAVALCGAYIAHVAYVLSPLSMPKGVLCLPVLPPPAELPPWHQRLESFAGPSCVWVDSLDHNNGSTATAHRPSGSAAGGPSNDDGGQQHGANNRPSPGLWRRALGEEEGEEGTSPIDVPLLPMPAYTTTTTRAQPPEGSSTPAEKQAALSSSQRWLARNVAYVTKARHYAWYFAVHLFATSLLRGLAAAQTEASCLGRNNAALVITALLMGLVVFLRPRPVPSEAGLHVTAASKALLVGCAALNTANAASSSEGGQQTLTNAVVWVSYGATAVAAVGVAIKAAHVAVNVLPSLFGTQTAPPPEPQWPAKAHISSNADEDALVAVVLPREGYTNVPLIDYAAVTNLATLSEAVANDADFDLPVHVDESPIATEHRQDTTLADGAEDEGAAAATGDISIVMNLAAGEAHASRAAAFYPHLPERERGEVQTVLRQFHEYERAMFANGGIPIPPPRGAAIPPPVVMGITPSAPPHRPPSMGLCMPLDLDF